MKLGDRIEAWVHQKYEKKDIEFGRYDWILLKFWVKVFPRILIIPLLFWGLKKIFIDFMLNGYGFEKTIVYLAIIMILRPMMIDVVKEIFKIRTGAKAQ